MKILVLLTLPLIDSSGQQLWPTLGSYADENLCQRVGAIMRKQTYQKSKRYAHTSGERDSTPFCQLKP